VKCVRSEYIRVGDPYAAHFLDMRSGACSVSTRMTDQVRPNYTIG